MDIYSSGGEQVAPSFLYRYRALIPGKEIYIERILIHNELYFPCLSQFNDPFDCNVGLSVEGTPDQYREYLNRLYKKKQPQLDSAQRREAIENNMSQDLSRKFDETLRNTLKGIRSEIGVLSLSGKRDDILMWSHYAGGHTGLCLEFRNSDYEYFFGGAQKVKYCEKYPKESLLTASDDKKVEVVLLTKSKRWEYEDEWRIIENIRGPGTYQFPAELLIGIIFGCQMTDEDKARIRAWVTEGQCQPVFYQARRKKEEFGLDIEPIE